MVKFGGASRILKRKFQDWSHSSAACYAMGVRHFCRYKVLRRFRYYESIRALLNAHHLMVKGQLFDLPRVRLLMAIENAIRDQFARNGSAHTHLKRDETPAESDIRFLESAGGIVLKAPRRGGDRIVEKGVLLLKFGKNFESFRRIVDVESVFRDYVLILEPGWSVLSTFDILGFTRFADHPIVVMATGKYNHSFLKELGTNLIPIDCSSSDWVNPSIFKPVENQRKEYDAVMVASWLPFKRHHVLFKTLRKFRNQDFRVALVSHMTTNREEVESLIDAYEVRKNLSIFEGLSQSEVNEILNKSRVNILLSLQEGSNRSLFEGFFAGVPGLALRNNVGIPKEYFTPETGKLILEEDLGEQLLYFRKRWNEFNPRAWAMANIAPERTTAKLNAFIRELAFGRGEEWTRDIVAKCNSPNLAYYPDEAAGDGLPSIKQIIVQYARAT